MNTKSIMLIIGALLAVLVLFGKKILSLFNKKTTNMITAVKNTITGDAQAYNKKYGKKQSDVLTVRASNPGALFWFGDDWQGMDKDKTQNGKIIFFKNYSYGVRAQIITLLNYQKRHDLYTTTAILNRWAPPGAHNNNTQAYVDFVSQFLGIDPDARIEFKNDPYMLACFAYAQHIVEAGFAWIDLTDFEDYANKQTA